MFNPQQKHGVLWVRWYRIFEPCPLQWKNSLCRAQLLLQKVRRHVQTKPCVQKHLDNGRRWLKMDFV